MAKWEIGNVCGLRMVDGKGALTVSYDGIGLITIAASQQRNKKTGADVSRDELAQAICDALNAAGVAPKGSYVFEAKHSETFSHGEKADAFHATKETGLSKEQIEAFYKELETQEQYPIEVFGMHGEDLGRVKSFGEAKAIHMAYLQEHHPELVGWYLGVSLVDYEDRPQKGAPEFFEGYEDAMNQSATA